MDTLRRTLAPLTFLALMALLFAAVCLGALLGPTLLLLAPLYVYLGGGVARFAFAELARGRTGEPLPVVVQKPASLAADAPSPPLSSQTVSPIVA